MNFENLTVESLSQNLGSITPQGAERAGVETMNNTPLSELPNHIDAFNAVSALAGKELSKGFSLNPDQLPPPDIEAILDDMYVFALSEEHGGEEFELPTEVKLKGCKMAEV